MPKFNYLATGFKGEKICNFLFTIRIRHVENAFANSLLQLQNFPPKWLNARSHPPCGVFGSTKPNAEAKRVTNKRTLRSK